MDAEAKKDYVDLLKSVYFFESLGETHVQEISRSCRVERHDAGKIIFFEGSRADNFYIVLHGAVEVWKDYGAPEQELLAVHGAGGIFGEIALVDDLPRSATVVTSNPTTFLTMNRGDFQEIVTENNSVAMSIMKSLSSIVRKSNDVLRVRNQQLEKTYKELKQTQDELLRAERLSTLGKFSSLILHDIRNPLSVLRGYAELILFHNRDKDRVSRSAERILLEVDRLNRLAGDLLDYCRGEIRLNMSMVNLEDFFTRFVQSIADRFSMKNIDVQTEILVSDPVIMDEERMIRVFSNLATNARKAMPRGGKFSIKAYEKDLSLVFEVEDTGVGMSEEVQKKVFEPFFSYSEGGTGLGMSIVKSIVEAHEGSLSVTSKVGHGTNFTILLPKIA